MGDASDACRDRLHALARFQKVMRNGQGQAGGRNTNDRKQCREIDCAVAGLKRRRIQSGAREWRRWLSRLFGARALHACEGYMCSGSRGRGNEAEESGGMHRRSKPRAVSRRDRQHHRRAACNRNAAHWSAVQRWGNARLPGSPKPQASIAFSSRGTAVQYQCGNRAVYHAPARGTFAERARIAAAVWSESGARPFLAHVRHTRR